LICYSLGANKPYHFDRRIIKMVDAVMALFKFSSSAFFPFSKSDIAFTTYTSENKQQAQPNIACGTTN
jgi:hypothetical protein